MKAMDRGWDVGWVNGGVLGWEGRGGGVSLSEEYCADSQGLPFHQRWNQIHFAIGSTVPQFAPALDRGPSLALQHRPALRHDQRLRHLRIAERSPPVKALSASV